MPGTPRSKPPDSDVDEENQYRIDRNTSPPTQIGEVIHSVFEMQTDPGE